MIIVIGTSRPFHLAHLARELSDLGHDVTLIGYMPNWKMKKYNLEKVKYKSIFWTLFPLSFIALQRTFPKLQSRATFLLMPLVDNIISKKIPKCDVFIGLSGVIVKSFIIAKEKYNALTICDRGSSHVKSQNALISTSIINRLPREYIERELKSYELCDYIMIPSQFAFDTFCSNGISKDKVYINNYGVDLNRFKKNRKSLQTEVNNEVINALYVGGWSYRKGCDIIYDVLKNNQNLFVTHIGTESDLDLPKHERFKSLGHICNKDLAKYYSNYDVFLLPSREDGFGMVLLEALACGLPIIASKNTGGPDIKKVLINHHCIEIMEDVSMESFENLIRNKNFMNFKINKTLLNQKDKDYFTWKAYGMRYDEFLSRFECYNK